MRRDSRDNAELRRTPVKLKFRFQPSVPVIQVVPALFYTRKRSGVSWTSFCCWLHLQPWTLETCGKCVTGPPEKQLTAGRGFTGSGNRPANFLQNDGSLIVPAIASCTATTDQTWEW